MQGVLLINLGTPDHTDTRSVYRYLTEFLNDPRVIDLPAVVRALLINLCIVPFRAKKSSLAYQEIWTDQGSPLLVNSLALQHALAQVLGKDYHVALAMRYGQPSIQQALEKLSQCTTLTIIPLFPQYASASTGSALEEVLCQIKKPNNIPAMQVVNNFYAHPGFISALAAVTQTALVDQLPVDHFLLSYHGLPVRQIDKSGCNASCNRIDACPEMSTKNLYCYRAQCYVTSRLWAQALNISSDRYTVGFQSRLGRIPWIKPYSDMLLPQLYAQGVKHLAVACPAFVADCLETLEEVNIRMRQQWMDLGGTAFTFIPCLNAHPLWVEALAEMV